MADEYIYSVAGTLTQVPANDTSAGASDAGKIVALDSTGHLDPSLMPTGIGADTASVTASEALAAGDVVNVWSNAGTANVRKADATTSGKEAHGYVKAAVASAGTATVFFEGRDDQVTGLTPGVQFLSTTPGLTTSTAPSGSGNVVQRLGVAVSGTELNFEAAQPIVLA